MPEDAARARLARTSPGAPPPLVPLPARRGARVVVVAGPGVSGSGVAGLRTLATITGATVVNTVGAKGLFAWDHPLHGGTVGLQVGDAALAEITTADLVITTGLDRTESASLTAALDERGSATPDDVVDLHPMHLALAAGGWPPAERPGARPPFYDAIAAVAGPLYQRPDSAPAAAAALAAGLPPGGLVVAPPGPAGFWVGRTFPTSVTGSVIITTGDPTGTAEAVARQAASEGRPVTLVLDSPTEASEAAAAAGATVEVWASAMTTGADFEHLVAVAGPPDPAVWPSPPTPWRPRG